MERFSSIGARNLSDPYSNYDRKSLQENKKAPAVVWAAGAYMAGGKVKYGITTKSIETGIQGRLHQNFSKKMGRIYTNSYAQKGALFMMPLRPPLCNEH